MVRAVLQYPCKFVNVLSSFNILIIIIILLLTIENDI